MGREFGKQMLEFVATGCDEKLRQHLKRFTHKLIRIFEDEVIAPAQSQILLDALSNDLRFHFWEFADSLNDEMTIVSSKIVEEDWNLIGFAKSQVAPLMRCATILPSDVIMIANSFT